MTCTSAKTAGLSAAQTLLSTAPTPSKNQTLAAVPARLAANGRLKEFPKLNCGRSHQRKNRRQSCNLARKEWANA